MHLRWAFARGMWLQRLLSELGTTTEKTIKMFSDSQPAISIAKNPVYYDKTKRIEIDRHFISKKVNNRIAPQ